MSDGKPKKWKEFEELAFRLQKQLTSNAKVTLNDSIPGVISGGLRQVDISIRAHVGQFDLLVALECKDWADPVDAPAVEAFISKLRDIRAQKGAMVAANGFTEGALNIAKHADIATYRLFDTQSLNWKFLLKIPWLLVGCHLRFKLHIVSHSCPEGFRLPHRIEDALALDANQNRLGKLRHLVGRQWNAESISHTPGTHHVPLSECRYLEYDGRRAQCEVTVIAEVTETRFFGGLGIEESKGYYDLQEKTLVTKALTLEEICPSDIEAGKVPGWRLLAPGEAAPPAVMEEHNFDAWPESDEDDERFAIDPPRAAKPATDYLNAETIEFLKF